LTIYKRVDDDDYTYKPTNHEWEATARALTIRERATLQGFPDSYKLDRGTFNVDVANAVHSECATLSIKITDATMIKIIGNSVVPTIASHIMSAVRMARVANA